MALPPVLSLRDAKITFGGNPLFRGVTLAASLGEKICLIGRNGSGKSTLLKVLAGEIVLDSGERFVQPGMRLTYLSQAPLMTEETVYSYVAAGLSAQEQDNLFQVDSLLATLGLDGASTTKTLSGGEARRAALARALVSPSDVLLLDEPTNHLDLPTILWLEEELLAFRGAIILISHDRAFLSRLSRQTLWLDRGVVHRHHQGYSDFDRWSEELLSAEEAELSRMDKKLEAEAHWLHRGVTARRKRNMGRLRKLVSLRQDRKEHISRQGSVRLAIDEGVSSGALVVEATGISKHFDDHPIVLNFSTRIMRGDRIGFVGPNGAGKSTLLKILTGLLEPDEGTLRLGSNLEMSFFDQHRVALDPDMSVWDTLTGGAGDFVTVRGQHRHVVGYMRDFLFEESQARTPVKALSGGEKNRLLLARLLAQPSNFLILDEPTNDLDMDTLDLLQEVLEEYTGTLLLVSHDRDFLDRLVTSVIAFEGEGRVQEYVGGFQDALAQGMPLMAGLGGGVKQPQETFREIGSAKSAGGGEREARSEKRRLSYKDKRDLETLPQSLETLQEKMTEIEQELADPDLFSKQPDRYHAQSQNLEKIRAEIERYEERLLEVMLLAEEISVGETG